VSPTLVRHAAREVFGRRIAPPWLGWVLGATAVAGAVLLAVGLWYAVSSGRIGGADTAVADSRAQPAPVPPGPATDTAAAAPLAVTTAGGAARPAPGANPTANPATSAQVALVAGTAASDPTTPRSVAQFLAAHAAQTGTDQAFARLFMLWKTPFEPSGARPCEQASAQGLECLAQKGTLAQLRLLNRPAILALVDASGAEYQVVVSQLGDSTARLEVGGAAIDANLLDLQRWWYGDFLILWRPPLPMARTLTPGMRGDEVRWLRQGLRTIRGEPTRTGGSDVYDRELVQLVQDFQRAHRLTVDGIAGTQTQVMIDALLGSPGAPTLRASGG
jgi:general secretion pathway protein A